jgi:glycosyltransferase involved in cell wall biosynthesis
MVRANTISVVIGTIHRPTLVLRAIQSALNQTHPPDELIVVIDGPDEATERALLSVTDPRLRVIQLPVNVGCAGARASGIEHASCDWIALLDDDDEWLPDKLAIQLECMTGATARWPIIAGRALVRTGSVDLVWPRRIPRDGELLCDYLFRRSLPVYGEGAILTCTWLVPRELFTLVPLATGLRRLEDIDWLLRAVREPGVEIVFPQSIQPLAVYHAERTRGHASFDGTWRISLDWGRERRHLFTPQAYAGFICSNVSSRASRVGGFDLFFELLSEARRRGRPSWVDLVSHTTHFTMTPHRRDAVSKVLKKLRIA